jgi:hypothetical protein
MQHKYSGMFFPPRLTAAFKCQEKSKEIQETKKETEKGIKQKKGKKFLFLFFYGRSAIKSFLRFN